MLSKGWRVKPATPTGDDAPGDADRGARVGVRCGHHVCVGGDGGWMRPFLRVETESREQGLAVAACTPVPGGESGSIMLLSSLMLAVNRLTTQLIWSMMQVWDGAPCSRRSVRYEGKPPLAHSLRCALPFPAAASKAAGTRLAVAKGVRGSSYRVALVFLRPVVCQLPPGVWRPITALWEGLDNGSLVGLFFFLNVDWDPLPQAWPVISFILCPGHCFTVGTVERKKQCAFYWLIKHNKHVNLHKNLFYSI